MRTREPRRKVFVPARMRSGTIWVDVCIQNMSSRGCLVQAVDPPTSGDYVEIRKQSHVVVGRCVWRQGRMFGIRTQDRIDIEAIVSDAARLHPQGAAAVAEPARSDRRIAPRKTDLADVAESAERSRRLSARLQFGTFVGAGLGVAVFAASMLQDVLAAPLRTIAAHLSPG